ncbi:MAG: hypothetical protein ACOCP8_10130 [archaeon]
MNLEESEKIRLEMYKEISTESLMNIMESLHNLAEDKIMDEKDIGEIEKYKNVAGEIYEYLRDERGKDEEELNQYINR